MRTKDRLIFENLPDIDALALTVYLEAEGESWDGKLAVAYVITNRSKLWKKGIKHIVYAPNQFSCFISTSKRYPVAVKIAEMWNRVTDSVLTASFPMMTDCIKAAETAMMAPDESTVGKATCYRVKGTKNDWYDGEVKAGRLIKLCEIGKHEFHEEKRWR